MTLRSGLTAERESVHRQQGQQQAQTPAGMGSYPGAILAALLLGVIEVVGSYLSGAVLGSAYLYLPMLGVLLVKPRGLLGAGIRI